MKECCKQYLDGQFGGDADVVGEIYGEYAASMREKMAEAKAALAAKEWEPLDKIAHAIKGNALAAGDQEMADTAIALRNAAKLASEDEAASLISRIAALAEEL